MWVSLYDDEGTSPVQRVGAGAGVAHPPIVRVPLDEAGVQVAATKHPGGASDADDQSLTIPEAKARLARTLGVDPSTIRITVEA